MLVFELTMKIKMKEVKINGNCNQDPNYRCS